MRYTMCIRCSSPVMNFETGRLAGWTVSFFVLWLKFWGLGLANLDFLRTTQQLFLVRCPSAFCAYVSRSIHQQHVGANITFERFLELAQFFCHAIYYAKKNMGKQWHAIITKLTVSQV